MTSRDEIRNAQEQVAVLQARLDNALRVQRVAERRKAAKQRTQWLLRVSTAVVAFGAMLVVWGRKKRTA